MLRLPRIFRSIENRSCWLYFFGQLVSLLGELASVSCAGLARVPPHGFLVPVGTCSFHRASAAAVPISYRRPT
jgi:hypothetical protein